jgi:hypothetical protein
VRSNCPAFQATCRRNADADDSRNTYGDTTAHLDAPPHADGDARTSAHTVDYRRLLRESRLVARFAAGLVH